jgi:hypothetical protein
MPQVARFLTPTISAEPESDSFSRTAWGMIPKLPNDF